MTIIDYSGKPVILSEERQKHILQEHQEIEPYLNRLNEVIKSPEIIKESVYTKDIRLFYRFYEDIFNGKYLVIVIKYNERNFIITCYVTDRIKGGKIIWQKK